MIINNENIKKFKREYNKAVKQNKEQFQFEGFPVLVSYAKYLIEYADSLKLGGKL